MRARALLVALGACVIAIGALATACLYPSFTFDARDGATSAPDGAGDVLDASSSDGATGDAPSGELFPALVMGGLGADSGLVDLRAYWRLDDSDGLSAEDATGGPAAAYAGDVMLGQKGLLPGPSQRSVAFLGDAGNEGYLVATSDGSGGTHQTRSWPTGFTLLLLVAPTAVDGTRPLVSKGGAFTLAIVDSAVDVFFETQRTDAGFRTVRATSPSGVIEPGAVHLIAATYDEQTLRLYVDGHVVDTQPSTLEMNANGFPLCVAGLSASSGCGSPFFQGRLDEIVLAGRAASATAIQALASAAGLSP